MPHQTSFTEQNSPDIQQHTLLAQAHESQFPESGNTADDSSSQFTDIALQAASSCRYSFMDGHGASLNTYITAFVFKTQLKVHFSQLQLIHSFFYFFFFNHIPLPAIYSKFQLFWEWMFWGGVLLGTLTGDGFTWAHRGKKHMHISCIILSETAKLPTTSASMIYPIYLRIHDFCYWDQTSTFVFPFHFFFSHMVIWNKLFDTGSLLFCVF